MQWLKKEQPVRREPKLMAGQNDYVFRRSRTLTGSISPAIAPSASKRNQLKTDRLKLHELKAHRRRLMRILIVVLACIGMLTFMIANFIITPSVYAMQPSAKKINIENYKHTIYAYFEDHPLERFGFLLNRFNLETHLKREHTEILSVGLERAWYGGSVRVHMLFRQPLLSWKTGNQQFYVDGQGIAFTYNHFAEPTVAVTDQTGLPPNQSGAIASMRFIRFLGRMVGAINDYEKGKVEAVIIPPSTRQIDLKLQGRSYPIKTNSDRDPLLQAEDVANALKWLDQKGIKPEYVDLRVAHKAYYK